MLGPGHIVKERNLLASQRMLGFTTAIACGTIVEGLQEPRMCLITSSSIDRFTPPLQCALCPMSGLESHCHRLIAAGDLLEERKRVSITWGRGHSPVYRAGTGQRVAFTCTNITDTEPPIDMGRGTSQSDTWMDSTVYTLVPVL